MSKDKVRLSQRTTKLLSSHGFGASTLEDLSKRTYWELKIALGNDERAMSNIAEVLADSGLDFAPGGHPIHPVDVGKYTAEQCYRVGITRFEQLAEMDEQTARMVLGRQTVDDLVPHMKGVGVSFIKPGKPGDLVTLVMRYRPCMGEGSIDIPVCQMPRAQAKQFCDDENVGFDFDMPKYSKKDTCWLIQDLPVHTNPQNVKTVAKHLLRRHYS